MPRPTSRDHELQRIDAGAEKLDRLLRQERRKAARLLAEGEQHRVVEHDAAGDRRHQPGVRPALRKRAHQSAFDQEPNSAHSSSAIATASGIGQPSRTPKA